MLLSLALLAAGLPAVPPAGDPPNVLILLADDLGVDQLGIYGVGTDLPRTPVIDGLADEGVMFRRTWTAPVCSPTRAMIQTGRYGFRTGIGAIMSTFGHILQPEEWTLPELLDAGTGGVYAHAAIGKWHLDNDGHNGPLGPNVAGWDHYSGVESHPSYYAWEKVENGVVSVSTNYLTTDQVDEALDWIGTASEPWVMYLAFSAPHSPYEAPPAGLYQVDLSTAEPPAIEPRPYYKAMVEALDTEIGRLLTGLGPAGPNTTVVFLGDNGTPANVVAPPTLPEKAKTSPYEGGIHVPLIIAGAGVTAGGSECDALVVSTDVYATVAELAGFDAVSVLPPGHALDSVSLVPYMTDPGQPSLRANAYIDGFGPNGFSTPLAATRVMRDERYKLIDRSVQPDELYDLVADPLEEQNLLEGPLDAQEQAAFDALASSIESLVGFLGASVHPAGCTGVTGSLTAQPSAPALGGALTLEVTNPLGTQVAGALPLLLVALAPQPTLPCGLIFPGWGMAADDADGEFILDPLALLDPLLMPPWPGPGQTSSLTLPIVANPALLSTAVYFQAFLFDPTPGSVTVGLTDAIAVQVGP